MPNLVSDLINQSYVDLGVIAPGDVISATMLAEAFRILNQLIGSISQEPLMCRIISSAFQPTAGTTTYTCGPGGAFDTGGGTATPFKAGPSWRSRSGVFHNGGKVLSFQEFEAAAQDGAGSSSVLASAVGADAGRGLASPNSSPLMTVRIFPTPAASPGVLDLDLHFPLSLFSATTDGLAGYSPGWERFLHFALALDMAPQYAREGGKVPDSLAADARNAKLVIMQLNASILGMAAPE